MLDRAAVRMTLMRTTLHLVSARDALALRPVLQGMIERRFATGMPFGRNVADLDRGELLNAGAKLLEQEPRTVSDLGKLLAVRFPGHDPTSLGYAVALQLPVVQVTPRGVWGMTMRPKVAPLATWLGRPVPGTGSSDDTILRYPRSFGPATAADIPTWSWLTGIRPAIERVRESCIRIAMSRDASSSMYRTVPSQIQVLPRRRACCRNSTTSCCRIRTGHVSPEAGPWESTSGGKAACSWTVSSAARGVYARSKSRQC